MSMRRPPVSESACRPSGGRSWNRTGRDNPLRGLPGYRCDPIEVAVVVQHGDVVPLRDSGDEQVGDSGGAVPGCNGQLVLHLQRSVPVGLADVEALKSCPLGPHRVVLARRPAAVENLQVDHRAGRHQTTLDQWGQLREDDRLVQTRVRALVSDERRYRHAEPMTSSSRRSGSPSLRNRSRWRRRAARAEAARSAALTVSLMVPVSRASRAAASAASSISTSLFVINVSIYDGRPAIYIVCSVAPNTHRTIKPQSGLTPTIQASSANQCRPRRG